MLTNRKRANFTRLVNSELSENDKVRKLFKLNY